MPDDKNPPGGVDKTPLGHTKQPRYTVKITFHSASNVPVSDINTGGGSDPFVLAQLNTDLPPRHSDDPNLRFRSKTIHRSTEPVWNAVWVVGGIPESGFKLKTRLYDADEYNSDDRLGTLHYSSGRIGENWKGVDKEEFKLRKSGADPLVYGLRWCAATVRSSRNLHARMTISIELLGKTEGEDMGKAFTLNNFWFKHYSPLFGKIAGTKGEDEKGIQKSDFQANELQLKGPVPNELYHRYVEFKTFIGGMFRGTGIRGRILQKALHHQHQNIYIFNNKTEYGTINGPSKEMSLQFLRMAHFDEGGRTFTYVITLDGLMRFTETGAEFGIDMLSKHTMHSDVNNYIAFSGEFLIRRLANPDLSAEDDEQKTHPSNDIPSGPPSNSPPEDPKYYELIIDNDSGTYRPSADLLPTLRKFLESNFPGLHVVTKACDDDELTKIKEEQKKAKEGEGDHMVFGQGSDGSLSSSDEEDLEDRAHGKGRKSKFERGVAAVEDPAGVAKGAFGKAKGGSGGTSNEKAGRSNEGTESKGGEVIIEKSGA